MPRITIDGQEFEVADGMTIIQACEANGIEIPKFCYHERLAIAGNCRMCLVKVEKMPNPVASCGQPIADGMVVHETTQEVKKMREGVMEFLLINHPLDCPICDQAGECDLQDQSMLYGRAEGRYKENKRSVVDKEMGPLIKTQMTRCIHCTRCVRFLEDVAGTCELGAVNRGEDMEITTYVEKAISSELSGNIIDLCPVGALTSKPYAFKARSWELTKTESIDVLDAVGSNIRIDSRGNEVMRILPRLNEDVNEEWISDRTRFSYDALKYQRLDTPMVKVGGKLQKSSWDEALNLIADKLKSSDPAKIGAIAGDLVDIETMFAAKKLLNALGSNNHDCRQDGSLQDNSDRSLYTFNTTIAGIDNADFCLIIGSNPRHEASILNARLRKARINNNMKVALVGEKVDLTYDYKHLGTSPWILKQISEGSHPICTQVEKAKNPMLIIGSGPLVDGGHEGIIYYAKKIASKYNFIHEGWNGFNVLQRVASRVGGMDIGFISDENSMSTRSMFSTQMDVLFLLGADELNKHTLNASSFVVYIGHHGDNGAALADVVLPAPAYTEKDGTYVNLEGRVQQGYRAVLPLGEAKPEWQTFADLASILGENLGFSNLKEIRKLMISDNKILESLDIVTPSTYVNDAGKMKELNTDTLYNPIANYYMTDVISRNSKTMAECTMVHKSSF